MKSLKESIIGSNNAGIFGKIKNLILNGETSKDFAELDKKRILDDLHELQKLWDDVGLGVKGCRWENTWKQELDYTVGSMILISPYYGRNDWDIEITRDDWAPNDHKKERKELIKKLENSGHFIIDKHPTGSEHWLAKIK